MSSAFACPSSTLLHQQILKTLTEMLTDRGYIFQPLPEEKEAFADLKQVALHPTTADRVFVYFSIDDKLHIQQMRKYVTHLQLHNIQHCIIVYAQQITPTAASPIPKGVDVEFFQANELIHNKTHHVLVPKHERIESEVEISQVLTTYKILSKQHLPSIPDYDPIVKYYHWADGAVIRISRSFGQQKVPEIYYRCVRKSQS